MLVQPTEQDSQVVIMQDFVYIEDVSMPKFNNIKKKNPKINREQHKNCILI